MRPLIVDLGKEFRGGQHQALLLLRGLSRCGHSPVLIALRDSQLARRAKAAGISVNEIAPGFRRLSAALNIRGMVGGKRVELIHANEPHALSAAWLARSYRSVPLIVSRRIALPLGASSISRARYRAAARIVAVSRFVAKSLTDSGIPSEKIEVIYDGVEIPPETFRADREVARTRFGIPQDSFCIGNVAALVPEKGHALLLHAFAELQKRLRRARQAPLHERSQAHSQERSQEKTPACALILRGEGPEKSPVQKLARELQIQKDVHFVPPDTDLATMFSAMDLFAFPSHAEPLGSALLAAMAHGVPCVALASGGVPEIIEDSETGLLVHSLDPAAFAAGLSRLQTDLEYARKIGIAAGKAVAARFSADHMVDATVKLYVEVMGAGER